MTSYVIRNCVNKETIETFKCQTKDTFRIQVDKTTKSFLATSQTYIWINFKKVRGVKWFIFFYLYILIYCILNVDFTLEKYAIFKILSDDNGEK